jgi:adenylate dimethylallyltransferase
MTLQPAPSNTVIRKRAIRPELHFILGATGVGKTAASVTLAEHLCAPVLVMDRLQIYPELAIGTGRPLTSELRGTARHYLTERQVGEGELFAPEAHERLWSLVLSLHREYGHVIIEGGSISLLSEVCGSARWARFEKVVRYIDARAPAHYCAQVRQRIEHMLQRSGPSSILAETSNVWRDPRTHAFVRSIVGYDAILSWCEQRGLDPSALAQSQLSTRDLCEIGDEMLAVHLRYARMQAAAFEKLAPQLLATDAQIVGEHTLCEGVSL